MPKQGNTDNLGSHIHVADGHPVATQLTTHQIFAEDNQQHQDPQHQVVFFYGSIDHYSKHFKIRNIDGAENTPTDPLPMGENPFDNKLGRQGGDRQIEAFNPQRRYSENCSYAR